MTEGGRRRLLAQVLAAEDGYDYERLVDHNQNIPGADLTWLVEKYDRIAGKALDVLALDEAVKP